MDKTILKEKYLKKINDDIELHEKRIRRSKNRIKKHNQTIAKLKAILVED